MRNAGYQSIKKIDDQEYLYFMYYNECGKQVTKYCGKKGTIRAEIVAIKTELANVTRILDDTNKYTIELRKKYNYLLKQSN